MTCLPNSGKLESAGMSEEAQAVAEELGRLKTISHQVEYNVARTYLETLSQLPWAIETDDAGYRKCTTNTG